MSYADYQTYLPTIFFQDVDDADSELNMPLLNADINAAYFGEYSTFNANITDQYMNFLDQVLADISSKCSSAHLAQYYADAGLPVYLYEFTQRPTTSSWPAWAGVMHGDEMAFVFGVPYIPSQGYSASEVQLTTVIQTAWANFAKTGNPSISNVLDWPKCEAPSYSYVLLDGPSAVNNNFAVSQNMRQVQCDYLRQTDFWKYIKVTDASGDLE